MHRSWITVHVGGKLYLSNTLNVKADIFKRILYNFSAKNDD